MLSYKELSVKHADYNPESVLERYEALYSGGKKFRDGIERFKFLDQRSLEGGATARPESKLQEPEAALKAATRFQGMSSRWEERKRISRYTNYIGGMFDYFVQCVFKDEPELVGDDPFWAKLKTDADGNGNPLSTVGRCGLLDQLKFNRAYLSWRVPEVPGARSLAEQRKAGGLDPVVDCLCAADVDLWDYVGKKLAWVRTYRKDAYRKQAFGESNQTRELWTYITEQDLIEYEIVYSNDNKPTDETLVSRKVAKKHGFSRLPVIPIQISADLWAMQRVEDPGLALYNREAAITWLVNSAAFQVLWIATGEQPGNVPDTAAGVLWVGLNGKAEFAGPQGQAFDAQFKDAEMKKNALYEVFQAMGVNALATQTQNARQSGDAKRMDKEPLYALLITFGFAMKSALEMSAALVAEFRGTPKPVLSWDLRGLNSLALDQKFKNLLFAQDVQGFSESARRQMLQDAGLSACPDAPAEVKQAIIKESMKAELEPPEIVAAIPDSPKGPIKNEPAVAETVDA
jgi:hypothetical protein